MNQHSGPIYLDASAWLKLYVPEAGSDALNQALAGRVDVVVSELGLTEVVSALARRARESGSALAAAGTARRAMIEAV